ncbi:glycosyltransferase family protein [Halalkalicoccus jeotgali]|uniref:Glycosyltransferase RgtA/B/C/D-like domain-containing protein n=1 Tax=Halalkalicoccus jeotgali (strain DSM 18796 / CECT 7217 / JCM 14584 / KCTC 4019 / B3) TaxID=795797 RepID=D8J6P4_HALJB|nr:hypothetical protein [Halalkalicoccus jeotgali]ADJ13921.1 hypothetical protein HacjB3_02640 [Halalkalicoccus jeotgali B3]
MIAVIPQTVRWHISGGGTVRGPAFLLVVTGLYVGVRLFKTGDRKWALPGAALYGLTMLTHPLYMAYFGLSYLVLYALFSRSVRGLVDGALVAVGGAIVGAPWWLYVSQTYGYETILNASATHGGLFSSEFKDILGSLLLFHSSSYPSELLIGFLVTAGAIYALSERRYALPIWFVVTDIFITQQRIAFIPGAMLMAIVVVGAVVPWLAEVASGQGDRDQLSSNVVSGHSGRETIMAVALIAIVVTTTWFGALYVAGDPPGEDRTSMSSYVDGDDIEAMKWVASETPPDTQFVVLDSAAEWFPYVAERTALSVWWGAEWTTPEQYEHQRALHGELSACNDEMCVRDTLNENNLDPEYIYVPKGQFATQADNTTNESDSYEVAYENDGVIIFHADN